MKIELKEIPIRDLVNAYVDNDEDGVWGYGGRLNIRPKFQREFVYKDKQRDAVIDTVRKDFPLNVMYWAKMDDDHYELLDGQQRTVSICRYFSGGFSVNFRFFHNLTELEKEQFLDYKIMVYICEGTDMEKLEWFKIINIAGEKLTDQELRNAVYPGEWLTDAKKIFSKNECAAYDLAKDYMKGISIRQDYLETVLSWIADKEKKEIEEYMAEHQHDRDAGALWMYFQEVIAWVRRLFPMYRKEMKGLDWGYYYNRHGHQVFDARVLEERSTHLMQDEDVTKKAGIYEYLLDGKEKHLSIRMFSPRMKREAYERQGGFCACCGKSFPLEAMEADHVVPWSQGGATVSKNCKILCVSCNREKSDK